MSIEVVEFLLFFQEMIFKNSVYLLYFKIKGNREKGDSFLRGVL